MSINGGARESLEEWRRVQRFRDALYRLRVAGIRDLGLTSVHVYPNVELRTRSLYFGMHRHGLLSPGFCDITP